MHVFNAMDSVRRLFHTAPWIIRASSSAARLHDAGGSYGLHWHANGIGAWKGWCRRLSEQLAPPAL